MCTHSFLQGIVLTQELNPHLLNWQVDSLPLNHPRKPRCELKKELNVWSGALSLIEPWSALGLAKYHFLYRKTTSRGTLSTPFWCLCQKLSLSLLHFNKLYCTKALSDQASSLALDWILLQRPRIPASFRGFSNNLSSWGLIWDSSGQGKDAWSSSSLFS